MLFRSQSSLPLTLRPPIDGEPCECKQEVADDVVTAGRMNWTAKTAKPQITDVDGMTLLGGEPAERVSGVDKGDGDCEYQLQIQQTNFYCEVISAMQTQTRMYLLHMECRLRGSGPGVRAAR